MGHFSLRSLLVAAIVISNCITWTASRHHYTHNVHGHRSRHRRQGAGLFLSSSYVVPGGEGAGAWGEWGEVSPCSRTCGGGVASQKRICLEVGPDGQPRCTGGDTKYFSCETQDCPDGSQDFRAQQCSEYDNVAFKGIKYTWVPYTKGPNPCELNCMPRGERFYYRQQSRVVDGTRCSDESFDVCVNGMCQPVGCDFMLGSSAREDKCRECRGNGTNCHTVSDLLDTQDLRNGYNDMLLIPEGATSINIEEVKPSSNYLAIRAKNNTYYLNGEYHIDFPRSIVIAGATWHYERSQNGLPSPDKLRCLGPTDEPLFLSLLLQEPNVGIQYEYSVPKSAAPPPNQQYNWVHGEFTPCSATCGGGFQTRDVTCRSREELEVVDESLCNDAFRPVTNQTCSTNPCAARWVEGPWGPCSKLCGEGGSRSRQVHCEKIITNGYPSVVADKECFELLGPKPPLFEQCNQNASCPMWFTGPWKPCDKLCDEGKQTRQVVCYQKTEGRVEVLEDAQCGEERPAAEQPCLLHPCDGVDWMLTDWVGCDTCLSTVRTRTAVCATKSFAVVNASLCAYHAPPLLEEPCDKTKLPACEVQWYATQWSKCSAECGKGVQTRRVFCGLFDGASVLKVDDARCQPESRYNDSRPCEVEECPNKWYAGPWSECTVKCGGGEQYRRVTCLSGTETASCDPDAVLDSTQSCNDIPCNEDKLIPVSPSSAPIMDEDEEEEDCEDEDYAEEGAEEDESLTTLMDEMFSDSPASDGSGFDFIESTESTLSTEEEGSGSTFSTETEETSETGSTETESTVTDLSSSSSATEATVSEDTAATDLSESTEESGATEATDGTGSTESTLESSSSSTVIVDYDYTDESSQSPASESDGTTVSGPTDATDTSASGSSDGATESSGATESTVSGASEASTEAGSTESSKTEETGTTESDYTDESTEETSESSSTDETSETSSESTLSTSSESETPDATTESGSTEASGSTSDQSTESGTTETGTTGLSGSTEVESTGSTDATESAASTEATTAESGSTEVSGSTEATSEGGSTESEATETSGSTESGATEASGSTEVSGSTESSEAPGSTESELTEGSTESGPTEVSGSTETTESGATSETETEVSGSTEESTSEGSTEAVTEETGSTVSGSEETGSTETGSSEGTTEGLSSVSEESTLSSGSTPYDWKSTIEQITKKPKVCKRRSSKCAKTKFGCCPDKRTAAAGPFDEGCPTPKTCAETEFGCCPDGVSPALGARGRGCPREPCALTLFGCCASDGSTPAEGNDQEGCPPPPPPCKSSKFGCCKDEKTQATGPKKQGCPETEVPKKSDEKEGTTTVLPESATCNATEFGCCPDGVSPAAGAQMEGCVMSCNSSAYGCCPDGETPAHGYDYEGCCLLYPYGCCPDNFKPAEGPHLEGCGCQFSRFGCCPDNVTLASGPSNEGCGCQYTDHGCCPDRHTPASGPEFAGCGCHTFQFGCCDDGVTVAKGPGQQGCLCQQTEFGCCGDDKTPAMGPDQAGCDCASSKYGCCPDGETPAQGTKFLGCTDKPVNRQAACALSTDRGPCTNYSVYWYYDLQYGGCSRFWYGGCEGNGNRFTSKEECEDVCVNPNPKDSCNLPMVKGACTGYHPRWHYDAAREACAQFVFGGCLGNANNFDTRELCQKQCEPAKSADQCSLPISSGSCAGNYPRWGWNAEAGRCEQFVWGGCEGNPNRFSSEAACRHRCDPPGEPKPRCKQPLEAGNCTDKLALWAFSAAEDRCVPFYHSGCGGNDNRFASLRECTETCPSSYVKDMCALPAVTGECADYTEKWFYDTAIKRCRQFYYGGCGGNENRFSTQLECENQCSELKTTTVAPVTQQTTPADVCSLPSMTGDCDDYKEKWFFDYNINRCRQFYYGGCGGNDNRFESEAACEARCRPARTTTTPRPLTQPPQQHSGLAEVCFLRAEAGPCGESQRRWAYDAARGACLPFSYGGCGGNQNNFPDKEYCEQACSQIQDVCQLPMMSGPCEESLMRWFYDPVTDSCSQFAYGGCEGNENRFESVEACEQRCRSAPAPVARTTPPAYNHTTPTPGEELPPACRILPEANEECAEEGEVWYLDIAQRACVAHTNAATGSTCRRTGVYLSEEACERTCGAFRNIEVCRYPQDPGPCRAAIPKFYFDEALGSCVGFTYGGCHGGPNRFSSLDECEDVCKFEKDPCKRTPKALNCFDYTETWFFDESRDECYKYGSCDPDDSTRFSSREECEGQCRRQPPATPRPSLTPQPTAEDECATPRAFENCDNSTTRFYYDAELRECVRSRHGDCRHRNSYASEEECERTCGAFRGLDACRSPLDVGLCNSAIPKFYWKLSSARCEPFAYSGCGGGPNRFSSAEECASVCAGTGPEQEGNEVLPDCDAYNAECASLRCAYGVVRARAAGGCERCACAPLAVDCAPLRTECEQIKCAYGVQRTRGPDGCERCTCIDHPCAAKACPAGERCVASPYRDPISQEIGYTADCYTVNKTGSCPPESPSEAESSPSHCRIECNDDADCRGVGVCCARGCGRACLEPAAPHSTARPATTTYAPELPQAPQANPVTEPEVRAEEGGKATLRCLFHGNPPPKITWRRGEITIDGDVGRYRLLSDGALEIVSLFRNDSGVYICVAENVHGASQQEVRLQVNDPVERAAGIAGEAGSVVTGELGRSLNVRCLAYGHPPPSIYWYRGRTMLPYSSELYEARENVLQIRKLDASTLGEYACQAFNGVGKPAVWAVEVRAARGGAPPSVSITPARPRAPPTSTLAPEIDVPVYTVGVNTHIPFAGGALAAGGELSLPCDVDGYPLPDVHWTKDDVRLAPDARTQITDARLTISGLTLEDSGVYGCHASNAYSSHSSTVQITVQGVFIPVHCTDNPFFADCKLIVRSKFCNHQYYSRFCCESCVKAGQLNALELGAQADEAWKRKK